MIVLAVAAAACPMAWAARGTVVVPYATGHPETHALVGHTGWVDVYRAGNGKGDWSRIGPDGTFTLPDPSKPVCLIAMFDKMETPPIIVPRWPVRPGEYDVSIPVEYACVPDGYPDVWDKQYRVRATDFCQTIVARGTELYGLSIFDGPKIKKYGNKMHLCLLEAGPTSEPRALKNQVAPDPGWSGKVDRMTSGYSDHAMLRAGWRHGNMETEPGKTYTLRVEGLYPHGGSRWQLDAYVWPDKGNGYPGGQAFADATPLYGDLCCLIFGNSHGQLVENQPRWDDWEVFVPGHRPATDWGQTFVSHGASLAGVCFWAGTDSPGPVQCEVRIRDEGPWNKLLGPVKVARGHESPSTPIIIYPDTPAQKPEYERYYKLPCQFFQVGYVPDELKLTPGNTYYVEVISDKPLLMYADGDYYQEGFAFYEGLKVDRQTVGKNVKHSQRWTLLMDIVTYENPRGAPRTPPAPATRPKPGPDGNLLVNGDAETGDSSWWQLGGDPAIDPSTDLPSPANHGGQHRFGLSVGWATADVYQYQELPDITPGAAYVADMWACHQDGTDESAELLWCDGPFGGKEISLARTENAAVPAWKHYAGQAFRPTSSTITIIVRYRHTRATNIASIHVDDITLKKMD